MLVDRPLFEVAILGPTAALNQPGNLASLLPGGLVELVPASPDGAMLDSISIIANEANTTASRVIVFLSTQTSPLAASSINTRAIASAEITSSVVGAITNISLHPILAPVHNVSRAGTGNITELEKKTTGLMIPKGRTLFVGLSGVLALPTGATTVTVMAQGGYY